jgi:hypothetical protein
VGCEGKRSWGNAACASHCALGRVWHWPSHGTRGEGSGAEMEGARRSGARDALRWKQAWWPQTHHVERSLLGRCSVLSSCTSALNLSQNWSHPHGPRLASRKLHGPLGSDRIEGGGGGCIGSVLGCPSPAMDAAGFASRRGRNQSKIEPCSLQLQGLWPC